MKLRILHSIIAAGFALSSVDASAQSPSIITDHLRPVKTGATQVAGNSATATCTIVLKKKSTSQPF